MSRRFQFSLRSLLVAIAVVAVPFAWVASNASLVRQRQAMLRDLPEELDEGRYTSFKETDRPKPLPWFRRLMGDRTIWFLTILKEKDPDAQFVVEVRWLFPEATIILADNSLLPADPMLREPNPDF